MGEWACSLKSCNMKYAWKSYVPAADTHRAGMEKRTVRLSQNIIKFLRELNTSH